MKEIKLKVKSWQGDFDRDGLVRARLYLEDSDHARCEEHFFGHGLKPLGTRLARFQGSLMQITIVEFDCSVLGVSYSKITLNRRIKEGEHEK